MKKNFLLKSLMAVLMLSAIAIGASSCKAQRVIITNATYTQQDDSTKVTTTITTKTTEEYTGVKKN